MGTKQRMRMKGFWLVMALTACTTLAAQDAVLRVNLVGYPRSGPKRALLLSKGPSRERLWLVPEQGGARRRLAAQLSQRTPWPPFTHCYEIDMDTVSTEGRFRIEVGDGALRSPSFGIGRYGPIQEDVVRFMQSQRCGYNPYLDRVCHPHDGRSFYGSLPDSSYVDARGGWHDAGDQLKYLITGSNATARMLMAWEWYGEVFADRVNAWGQEGPNGLADILDEARWGLDWIHRLHPASDQLIHQVADDRDHRGFKMPYNDSSDYGWGPNSYRAAYFATGRPQGTGRYQSEATGVANIAGRSAAAMAMGHRIWKRLGDSVFSGQCLADATSLYRMGKAREGFQQGNSYGAPYRYNERTWADDMEWAAAELFKATGRREYLDDAIRYADMVNTDSWMERDSVAHYEMYPYVNIGHHALWQVADETVRKRLEGYYRHNLERIREKALRNDYGVGHLFVWCSNNFAAAVATQALLYERMTGDTRYRKLLQDHVNWLLGLNPWGSSMITGVPDDGDYPLDVHMPFWRLLGKMVKGSLVDGPLAASIHDRMLQISLSQPDEYAHLQPGHVTYWDDWADYSTNEPTMDGSADLFLILAYLNSGR
jgi:endoglucanase